MEKLLQLTLSEGIKVALAPEMIQYHRVAPAGSFGLAKTFVYVLPDIVLQVQETYEEVWAMRNPPIPAETPAYKPNNLVLTRGK